MSKECSKQLEITSASTTLTGNHLLRERLSLNNNQLQHALHSLDLIKSELHALDEYNRVCQQVSDWLEDAATKLLECKRPWADTADLEYLASELEVRFL